MGGEAVLAQHHTVGPGGTGRGDRAGKVSSGRSFPLSGPLWAGAPINALSGGLALASAGMRPSQCLPQELLVGAGNFSSLWAIGWL